VPQFEQKRTLGVTYAPQLEHVMNLSSLSRLIIPKASSDGEAKPRRTSDGRADPEGVRLSFTRLKTGGFGFTG
jgi:hypothetical protein